MRLICPLCGPRDRREFYYYGASDWLARPAADAPPEAWHAYLHLRDNPAGPTEDLWYHEQGCGQWLRVRRDTLTHAVEAVSLVMAAADPPAADASGGGISAKKRTRRREAGDAA
jgi:sarcosine oxidase subunit delta